MAVNLSPIGGVAAQFLDNSGNPLSGGKIYTYAAGTTTPQSTFTSSNGATAHANPIILDAAGRVPTGEIWLTDGLQYKFIIKTSTDVQIGSYDNIIGINSNFINYTNSQEIQTATSGQTVFTLTTMVYQPGTGSLSVFVDGVNQYGPGASYAFQETSDTVVTFTAGLHVGASVKFTTSAINASSYGDAQQISYVPPFTGGVATNVEAKLAQTVSVTDFGAVGDGSTDDTAAIQAALTAAERVYFPTPTVSYLITSINIPANRTLVTDGVSTKFQQKTGTAAGTRVFYVMGPNVTIGDMTVQGNIATDTDEQNHAIMISSGTAGTNLYNIRVGNIRGVDIRGDVVYIGQVLASGTTTGVSVASADGNNILRNVVSIVGGSNIEIGQVTGPAVGYMHLDIEPDGTYTGNAVNVRVGQVTGRHIGVVVNTPSGDLVFSENIQFGEVNLDPAFATQSTPAYSPGATIASRAVLLRSAKDISIGTLKVNGYDGSAIWKEGGGVSNISLVIGQAFFSDCNKVDGNTYGYVMCNNVTFGYLNVDTPLVTSVQQRVLQGDDCVVNSGVFSLGASAVLIRSQNNVVVRNSTIAFKAGATLAYVALGSTNSQIKNCTVTGAEYLAGFVTGIDVENSTVTASIATLNTTTEAVYKNSTINGQYYAFATGNRVYTEAIAFGGYFLWVDATGDLRIKSGAPTSDTDGTVVGTQT
jgi:hypothetical protein